MKIGGNFTGLQTQASYYKKQKPTKENSSESKVETSEVISAQEEDQNNIRIAYLSNKLQGGQELSKEELAFLEKYAPGVKSSAMEANKERESYRESLERCRSKDEVNKLKLGKELDYYAKIKKAKREGKEEDVNKLIMFVNTIQNEHNKFVQTKEFTKLPDDDDGKFREQNKYINHINDMKSKRLAKQEEKEKELKKVK